MKKFISVFVVFVIMFFSVPVFAASGNVRAESLEPIQTESGFTVLLGKWNQSGTYADGAVSFNFFYRRRDEKKYTVVNANKNTSRERYNILIEVEPDTDYLFYFAVKMKDGRYRFGDTVSFHTLPETEWSVEDSVPGGRADNLEYIFGDSTEYRYLATDPPAGYATAEEAAMHMTEVTVPVWIIRDGKKCSSEYTFEINAKLAGNITAVFEEIYELPEKYPVKLLKTFKYRKVGGTAVGGKSIDSKGALSMHSFGTAIDVNPSVNGLYYMRDGRNTKSPYYLSDEIVNIFKKYGWEWGGDWSDFVDTMHFQFIG